MDFYSGHERLAAKAESTSVRFSTLKGRYGLFLHGEIANSIIVEFGSPH
jgi:hypothetical protein